MAKARFVLAPGARDDLRDILRYTVRRWGSRQRDIYKQALYRGFDELARHPLLGRARPEYGENVRSFPVEEHLVIYDVTETKISIARIIHQRRDIDAELGE